MDLSQRLATSFSPSQSEPPIAHTLASITRWGVRVLMLLLPLMFLPSTFEGLEFNKQFWLLGVGFVLLVIWFGQVVATRQANLIRSPLHWSVLALVVVAIGSTITSVDPITSTLGFYGRFNGGLLSVVGYVLLFFLVTVSTRDRHDTHWLLGAWLSGVGVASLVLVLQLLGLRWLPFAAAGVSSFTPLGGALNAVVLALAASLPLAIYFARAAKFAWLRTLALILSILVLVVLVLVDYHLGWLGVGVGAAAWLALLFYKNETAGFQWAVVPALAIILSLVAWPLTLVNLTRASVPVEVNLSLSASWKIALQNAKGNPLLGTGPDTFSYGFSKFKPEGFNDSNFWTFRFNRATSEFAQVLSTTGFLGLAAFLALLGSGLYLAWTALKDRMADDWYLRAAVVASYLVLVVAQVVYFLNTTLAVMTWLMLGLLAVMSSRQQRRLSLTDSPRASLSFSFGLAVVVLAAAAVWLGIIRFWLADAAYARAQRAPLTVEGLTQAQTDLTEAVNLNPWRDTYRVSLAQVLLGLANNEASQQAAATEEEQQVQVQRLQTYIAASIAAARSATELSSQNVANWETLGSIYRGTVLFALDAEPWVISSFEQAVALEPSNPALFTELGKAYLISASRKRQQAAEVKDD
ncbi:MAG: hypothetical protein U1C53_00995, partial [Candidatus Veblenbacteria bacterium]|nr:hypothetical protein [Candidatus Veblenbacteria bacterium]